MFRRRVALCSVFLAFLLSITSASWGGSGLIKGSNGSSKANPLVDQLFLWGVPYSSGGYFPYSVAVADFNRDGKPDLVVANCGASECGGQAPGNVAVLLGNGDGTFQAPLTFASGGSVALSVAVADVNGDGAADLAVANGCADDVCAAGSIGVLLGNGDGTFQAPMTYASGNDSSSVAFADVNLDGKPDILVNSGGVGVLLGKGNGTFRRMVSYATGGSTRSVAVADLNGDGKPDVVVSEEAEGRVAVLLGKGDGTFLPVVSYETGESTRSVAVADLNGDGKPDLIAATFYPTTVAVLVGKGDGTFQTLQTYNLGDSSLSLSLAAADVNGDGKLDVLLPLWSQIGVLLGNGDGTLQELLSYDSGGRDGTSIAIADVNGDNKPDALVAFLCGDSCSAGAVGVFLNNSGYHSPTITTLASSLNPAEPNQRVTYTATVTSQYDGPVTGKVLSYNSRKDLAFVALQNKQATYSTSYPNLGSHTIFARYYGDADSEASEAAPLTEFIKILPVGSKTVVSTSGSPSLVGQPVTFTATVTSRFGRIPDNELVTFYDGTNAVATVALTSGVANYTTSSLSPKSHYIQAIYAGDQTFKTSTGHIRQVVNK